MRRRTCLMVVFIALLAVCLLSVLLSSLPSVRERLGWRVASAWARLQRALNPPQQVVFVPAQVSANPVETMAYATLQALYTIPPPGPTPTMTPLLPSATMRLAPSETPTASPTATDTPVPEQVRLQGIIHEYQQFNNCGPANLAMALSYWGWQGDQRQTRAFLRPNREVDDKNVMPEEMVAFVETHTTLNAISRVGGNLDLLKRLLAAGFPVIIEAGHDPRDDFWMGHYLVISGYDDAKGILTVQDSLIQPDMPYRYDELGAGWWRDFNYVYLVIYPPERESEVFHILGEQVDPQTNYAHAAQKALDEISRLQGRDLFFAWFNLGSSLVGHGDYVNAANAYDQAFSLYQGLPEDLRPYRLMWYQVGPYQAYYHSGRYQDVINLANTTFAWVGQPVLEESYYWRGMAYDALGDRARAAADISKAALLNPNYALPRQVLQAWGTPLP